MKFRISLLAMFSLCAASAVSASDLLECRDDQLHGMSAASLRDALSAAGAKDCLVRPASWGESVACQGTKPGTRAFGVAVREFSAEIQNVSGKRTIQIVTVGSISAAQRAMDAAQASSQPGLEMAVESDESGVHVISCMAIGAIDEAPAALASEQTDEPAEL